MNPFEYMQALTQMWARSAQGFAAAQPGMFSDPTKAMDLPVAFFDPQGVAGAKEAFDKLWSSAVGISQTITRNMQKGEKVDPAVTELLGKLFDPRAWFSSLGGMDEALQRMAEGPRLADLWDNERKLLNLFTAWTALRQRSIDTIRSCCKPGWQAAGAFAKTLNEKAERKETLGSWRDILALWVETANTALLETQRSASYLKSQREILKASTDLRLAQQEVAAFYSEVFGYPDARGARRCASHCDRAPARAARPPARRPSRIQNRTNCRTIAAMSNAQVRARQE